jgi:hypothetical protein
MSNTGQPKGANTASSSARSILSGSLEEVDIFSIAQFLVVQRKTGALTISQAGREAIVWFVNGDIVNGRAPGCPDGLEAVRGIFRWKIGSFVFAPTTDKIQTLITTDAQSLLMDLAIEVDETTKMPAARGEAPPSVAGPPTPSSTPAVRPAVVRVVRPTAGPSQPPLASRMGSLPASALPVQPRFARRPYSQEEFIREIEQRLEIQEIELPRVSRDLLGRHAPRRRPAAGLITVVAAVGVPAVLIMSILVAWLATTTAPPGKSEERPDVRSAPVSPQVSAPAAKREYKFITAPNSPARPIEQCIADIPRRCELTSIAFDPKDVRQVNIVLTRETFWDKTQLAMAIAQDSVAIVQSVFERNPVDRILLVARSRLSREVGQQKLEETFRMSASRSAYMSLKPTYNMMSPLVIVHRFGGQFSAKLAEP